MDSEIRSACPCRVLLEMENEDIFDKPQEAYGEGYVSYLWLCKGANPFREGRTSLAHSRRSEQRPIPDGIERIRVNVECELYQSRSGMARDLGLSKTDG
jgi:hypothetical protein